MRNLYQKLAAWYRGKPLPYSMQEMIDLQQPKYGERQKPLPERFNPPLVARILNTIGHFLCQEWKWTIGTIIAFSTLLFAYLKFVK